MPRGIHKLTVLGVAKAARQGLTLADGGGLYLQRGSAWIFRYARHGCSHWLGLGPLELVDLPAAREAAQGCRKQLVQGIDPLAHAKAQRAAHALQAATSKSFDECVADYITAHGDSWRSATHRRAWEASLRIHVSPTLGKMPVAMIDTSAVLRALEPIWKDKTVTASRLRGRIERVIGWAGVKGYRDNDIPNPARWRGHLDHLLAATSTIREVKHFAALSYAELPSFMSELRKQEGTGARALEFLILCGVRTGDVLGMKREHVDLDRKLWVIPKTKNGSEHRVPLSRAALAVLDQMTTGDVVFPGHDKMLLLTLKEDMGRAVTVHGFRSALKTWAAEETNFERDVIESVLAHTINNKLERAYRRGDFLAKRAQLMSDWADFCQGRSGGATVVPLRA